MARSSSHPGAMNDDFPHHSGGVLQVQHVDRWGAVPEALLEDRRLELDARAVAAWLAIKPSGWQISVVVLRKRLAHNTQDMLGKDRWQRIAQELEAAGYLSRKKINGVGGKWIWHVTFNPVPTVAGKTAYGSTTIAGFPGSGVAGPVVTAAGDNGNKGIPTRDLPIYKTTTTNDGGGAERIDDLVEAATWAAKKTGQIRNEAGFRHRIRTRITSDGPNSEDLRSLRAWRAHQSAIVNDQKRAEQQAHELQIESEKHTQEAARTAELEAHFDSLEIATRDKILAAFSAHLAGNATLSKLFKKDGPKSPAVRPLFLKYLAMIFTTRDDARDTDN